MLSIVDRGIDDLILMISTADRGIDNLLLKKLLEIEDIYFIISTAP